MRHLTARMPSNNGTSSWFRGYDEPGKRVHYRLFLRSSITRAFSYAAKSFPASTPRSDIARAVNASRRELRGHVAAARRLSAPATGKEPLQVADVEALHPSTLKWLDERIHVAENWADDTDSEGQRDLIHWQRLQRFARRLSGAQQAAKGGA